MNLLGYDGDTLVNLTVCELTNDNFDRSIIYFHGPCSTAMLNYQRVVMNYWSIFLWMVLYLSWLMVELVFYILGEHEQNPEVLSTKTWGHAADICRCQYFIQHTATVCKP